MAQLPRPRRRAVQDLKNTILDTALTTHYECKFTPPPAVLGLLPDYTNAGDESPYVLSCFEASLPGTSLATAELTNDHPGITERHVHRRQYDATSSFSFYVDRNYRQIRLFETWIGYIVNEQNNAAPNYFYRVNFPKQYQVSIYITKFERDFNRPLKEGESSDAKSMSYRFINAYPISIDAMPVSYDGAQVLKCTVNFNFSRYINTLTSINKIQYPLLEAPSTETEVEIDNSVYGNSVPQGSFGITGQGANRDPNRHSASNTNNNNNAKKIPWWYNFGGIL
tara:strand:+ start:207 stop:1049 length:843 start_codon:yes stop_codon:yes gene_type:complete